MIFDSLQVFLVSLADLLAQHAVRLDKIGLAAVANYVRSTVRKNMEGT